MHPSSAGAQHGPPPGLSLPPPAGGPTSSANLLPSGLSPAVLPSVGSPLEGLKSGVDSLFAQLHAEKLLMGREIASLERDAGVWRESYLALDDERNQWRAKLEEIERQLDVLARSGPLAAALEIGRALPGVEAVRSGAAVGLGEDDGPAGKESFVLALIDVETVCFSRSLLKKGREGGERAAGLLHDALVSNVWGDGSDDGAGAGEQKDGRTLVGFAFVDRFELGRFIMAEGVLDSWTTLDDFVLGFNGARVGGSGGAGVLALVDTARADVPRKLSGHLKLFGAQDECAQIVLATSEVTRYKRLLSGFDRSEVGVAGCDRSRSAGFPMIPIPGLFSRGLSAKRIGEDVIRPATPDTVASSPPASPFGFSPARTRNPSPPPPPSLPPQQQQPFHPAPAVEDWTVVVPKSKVAKAKPLAAGARAGRAGAGAARASGAGQGRPSAGAGGPGSAGDGEASADEAASAAADGSGSDKGERRRSKGQIL